MMHHCPDCGTPCGCSAGQIDDIQCTHTCPDDDEMDDEYLDSYDYHDDLGRDRGAPDFLGDLDDAPPPLATMRGLQLAIAVLGDEVAPDEKPF